MEELYIKVEDLGGVIDKYFEGKSLISVIELIGLCEDLSCDLERLQEKYDDFKEQVRDNYKPISQYSMYGINERDFH